MPWKYALLNSETQAILHCSFQPASHLREVKSISTEMERPWKCYIDNCEQSAFLECSFPQPSHLPALEPISRAALVAQRFSAAFGPGCDPGDPGSSPMSGSLCGVCFSLPVSQLLILFFFSTVGFSHCFLNLEVLPHTAKINLYFALFWFYKVILIIAETEC